MDKPKVMLISAANSIHTVRWVNALINDFEIHLVFCKNHKPTINKINPKVILHELNFNAPLGYYLNVIQLKKLYQEIRPDIINVHYASGYGTLARISKLRPVLLSVWGSDVYEFPKQSKLNRKILQKNVTYANSIASTSNAMAEELKNQVAIEKKDIIITPFGVDVERFKKDDNKQKDKDSINIGIIKTLEENYGIKYAILAIKKVKEELISQSKIELANSIKLYIYGERKTKRRIASIN